MPASDAPETPPPLSPEANLGFQQRWLTRAGFAALAGGSLLSLAFVFQIVAQGSAENDADLLAQIDDRTAPLLAGGIMGLIGFTLTAVPLFTLFRAARGRAPKMLSGLIGMVFIGPICLGLASLVLSLSLADAADEFVSGAPAEEARTAEPRPAEPAKDGAKEAAGDSAAEEKTDEKSGQDSDEKSAREQFAEDTVNDSPLRTAGGLLGTAGLLGMMFATAYTSLWAMRTGLLSRFMGTLGMALGIGFPIITQVPLGMWFAGLGAVLLGWPNGRPPAWDAGRAIPWPKPGDELAASVEDDRDSELESVGLPPEHPPGETGDGQDSADGEPAPQQPMRKRKRRR